MPFSQNGFSAGDRSLIYNPVIPGTVIDFPGGLRKGPAGDLLLYVAAQLHSRVENGGDGYGMWGYAYRPIRGFRFEKGDKTIMAAAVPELLDDTAVDEENRPCCFGNEDILLAASSLSNHSSGTSFDWNAPKHPLGKVNTFSAEDQATIRAIVNIECERAVRWGGDYTGRKDDMHFEVVKSESECARILSKLRGAPAPSQPAPTSGHRLLSFTAGQPLMVGDDVKTLQRVLNGWYQAARPSWWPLALDGEFGKRTGDAVRYMQGRAGLAVDGVVGPDVRRVLGL